ncbi:cytochrome P450 [Bradyrhizobium sp. CCBAU 53338]|uniref:cytochrome P450 n=1 Tax=Bradyrhizobium sp. CCBAU 53338 TaxID=1325111 RepID=UPI00188C56ED|nr:cytochrome P450 [Bradyrhizobium sp. CCBAU 53338]QOZ52530.1 cytochrome P450 [Bradyrhizobium sp. CCBAU 53338]
MVLGAKVGTALYQFSPPPGMPIVDADPFSDENLASPYELHQLVREAGPIVWLSRYNIAAVARYAEVREVFADWRVYTSTRGVGMADYVRHGRFRIPSLILEVDPPEHTKNRSIMMRAMSPVVMDELRDHFKQAADRMVSSLVGRRRFDAISDLAEAYPLLVFPDAIGMKREGRDNLLPYGDMIFNSFGPANHLFEASAPRAEQAFPWVRDQSLRKNLSASGFGMIIFQAVDAGEISEEDGALLVKSFLTAGVDTTVSSLGAALYSLVRFPEEWEKLHANPSLARAAFEEAIRFECPVQTFFRTTAQETEFAGFTLEEGTKILLFLGAANRDPRQWPNPDRYDILRRTIGHVGYGHGIHVCLGQLLARLEGEAVLSALARQVRSIRSVAEPERRLNNTLRGLKSLPIEVTPA